MVIQAYASTNNAMDEEKDKFYNQLQDSVASCSSHDMIVVMGDLNIKVGSNNINREEVMGKFGVKVMNDNGERICCNWNSFLTLKKPLIKFTEKSCGTSWGAMAFHVRWRQW